MTFIDVVLILVVKKVINNTYITLFSFYVNLC